MSNHRRYSRSLPSSCNPYHPRGHASAATANNNNNNNEEGDTSSEEDFGEPIEPNNNDNGNGISEFQEEFRASFIAAINNSQRSSAGKVPVMIIRPSSNANKSGNGNQTQQQKQRREGEVGDGPSIHSPPPMVTNRVSRNRSQQAPRRSVNVMNARNYRLGNALVPPHVHSPPILDEALKFVESTAKLEKLRAEICAEFVQEYFSCPICLDVLVSATALTCGHRFCRSCITTWLKQRTQCPICEEYTGSLIPLYENDIAIDSVANYLSAVWRNRNETAIKLRQSQSDQLSSASTSSLAFTWTAAKDKVRVLYNKGKRRGSRLWKTTRRSVRSISRSQMLPQIVLGILIGTFVILVLFNSDEIVDFVQYLYLAMVNYGGQSSSDGLEGGEGKRPGFKEFEGSQDTLYAKVIKRFYAYY